MRSLPYEEIEQLDLQLVDLTRGSSRMRLELGTLIEELARRGGHHELGFSTLEGYVLERCGRSARWSTETRTLARRLSALPVLRAAVFAGEISWCMAELVARHAKPESEAELLTMARRSTVRAMRERFGGSASDVTVEAGGEDAQMCSLRVTAGRADIWLLEWTRRMAEHIHESGRSDDAFVSALLAEAHSSLCSVLPSNDLAPLTDGDARREQALQKEAAWRAQLAAWRAESERRCEANFVPRAFAVQAGSGAPASSSISKPPRELSLDELDGLIAELSERLTCRDLELAGLARTFHEAEGWRRLGYSTEQQYARERLGISPSSFKARVALSRRLLGPIKRALESATIGYESALLISRVATIETVAAWIERAERRTVKHLADEVRTAELVARVHNRQGGIEPPNDELLRELALIEGQVLSGNRDALAGGQMSACLTPEAGTVSVSLRVTRDTARFYRVLEGILRPYLPRSRSFLGCLCELFWDAWQHLCQHDEKYRDILARDCFRCANPTCRHRGNQPHHIQFRSQGGSDEDENLLTLCVWCHLEGVHGGRMRVTGSASAPHFELGRKTRLVVTNRERKRVSPKDIHAA